jgi:hypothetical protein
MVLPWFVAVVAALFLARLAFVLYIRPGKRDN